MLSAHGALLNPSAVVARGVMLSCLVVFASSVFLVRVVLMEPRGLSASTVGRASPVAGPHGEFIDLVGKCFSLNIQQ